LALLNDGAILSIAYDNVHYKDQPEAWNMRMVLGVATVLGVIGVVSAFGLFYLGERVFHLDRTHIQTLMYLKLSVAGHLTIFLTRTRGPFWSIRPARALWIAVLGTQVVATLIAVYGLFMTPLGWGWAGFVWGYALLWFLVNDRVKLLAYRIFDPIKAKAIPESKEESKPDAKAEPKIQAKPESQPNAEATVETKPATKVESKPETKAETKPEGKAEPKPEVKIGATPEASAKRTSDFSPQIATRAYELYEQQGRREGQSVQNWDKAEREIQKDQAKDEPKPEVNAETKPENTVEAKPETKVEPKPEAKVEPKSKATEESTPDAKADHKVQATPEPEPKAEATPAVEPKPEGKEVQLETKTEAPSDVSPQLVKRVHEFYEQLGREDVRAVEDLEKAERETREKENAKNEPT
ncbi:MAG: DUF2934 domain-containing protein, partial [Nitrospirota bacterium]